MCNTAHLASSARWGESVSCQWLGPPRTVPSQGGPGTTWEHVMQSSVASELVPLLTGRRFEVRGAGRTRRPPRASRQAARLTASSARAKPNETPHGTRGSGQCASHVRPHEQRTGRPLSQEAARLPPALRSGLYLQQRTEHCVTLETANKGRGQSCKNPGRSLGGGRG